MLHLLAAAALLIDPRFTPTAVDPVIEVTLPQEPPPPAPPPPPAKLPVARPATPKALPPTRIDGPAKPERPLKPAPSHEAAPRERRRQPASTSSGPRSAVGDSPARYIPGLLVNSPPVYPALARQRGEQGPVVFEVQVEPDGSAGNALLVKSSGYPSLDAAALSAVRQWHFVPAKRGGRASRGQVKVTVNFRLAS